MAPQAEDAQGELDAQMCNELDKCVNVKLQDFAASKNLVIMGCIHSEPEEGGTVYETL